MLISRVFTIDNVLKIVIKYKGIMLCARKLYDFLNIVLIIEDKISIMGNIEVNGTNLINEYCSVA